MIVLQNSKREVLAVFTTIQAVADSFGLTKIQTEYLRQKVRESESSLNVKYKGIYVSKTTPLKHKKKIDLSVLNNKKR